MNEIIIGVVPSLISLFSIIITAIITNSLIKYRVEQLEKKVEKHNQMIERVYKLEAEVEEMRR